jgi:hypothetical protein
MRRSILSITIFLMFLTSFANAFSVDMAETQKNIDLYNKNIDRAPDVLKGILGNEKINLDITRDDGSVFQVGLDVVAAKINKTVVGGWSDPSITITTTESAINNIRGSKDPIAAFQQERDQGQMTFEAKNWLARAKLEAVLSSTSVLQFGYSLFFG